MLNAQARPQAQEPLQRYGWLHVHLFQPLGLCFRLPWSQHHGFSQARDSLRGYINLGHPGIFLQELGIQTTVLSNEYCRGFFVKNLESHITQIFFTTAPKEQRKGCERIKRTCDIQHINEKQCLIQVLKVQKSIQGGQICLGT